MGLGGSAEPVVLPSLAAFQSAVGSDFSVGGGTDPVVLSLVEVTTFDGSARFESFSALFAGSTPILPQGIYPVSHDALGAFDLFLVPVVIEDGQRYEAVFNRPSP